MKAAACLPSPFPSPPLLISPSAHTSTPWSPLATRHALYVEADLLLPAALHPVPTAGKQASKNTHPVHMKGRERCTEKRAPKLVMVAATVLPLTHLQKHPPFPIMLLRHRQHTSSPTQKHTLYTLTNQQEMPSFFVTSGATQRGNVHSYLATTAHLQLQICSP